jgi:3-oxoacyl-[acyl-carrier protein] reductase
MRNVIVTGVSRGLGLGMARRLASSGYRVVGIARQGTDELAAAAAEAEIAGGAIHFRAFDLAETSEIHRLVRQLRDEFGAIHALVNNAGLGTSGVLTNIPDMKLERLVQLNVLSPIILTKYVLRPMMADGGGRIVNVASIVAFSGFNGLSAYGATKASLVGFTRSLARDVGRLGITVNAVAPGFIDTELTRELGHEDRERIVRRSALRRLAEITDVAAAVEFLVGDGAKNITGTVITVDAGSTA